MLKRLMFLRAAAAVVLVLCLGIFVACQQKEKPLPLIRFGHAPHDHHATLFVAAMNPDYFKSHGGIYLEEVEFAKQYRLIADNQPLANVSIDSSTGGKELIRKLTEGHFDISFGGLPAVLLYIDQGSPLKVLSPIMAEGSGLVLRKDLPPNNWHEFVEYVKTREQPLRIGYKSDVSVQQIAFELALRDSGITYSEKLDDGDAQVIVVNLYGAKNLIPAMENSLIDGFVVMQPFLALAEEKGSGKTVSQQKDFPPEGKWHGTPCCVVSGNSHFVDKYPIVTEKMVTLLLRANKYITEHQEQSAVQVAHWLGINPSVESRSLPTIKFTNDIDTEWQRGVDLWVENMVKSGELNHEVKKAFLGGKIDDLIYNRIIYDQAREKQ